MENESIKYLPLGQSDPFGNEGTIGDLLGRFCNNNPPQEISLISPAGIRFPPYPGGQFGSDQLTGQDSNKSSLLDPADSDHRVQTPKPNSRKRKSIPVSVSGGNGKDSPASSSLTASNSKV